MIQRLKLAKIPLCLLIGFSTAFGAVLFSTDSGLDIVFLAGAVFILATGAATLNSYQEYRFDRTMQRTRNRPLASGLISPPHAFVQAILLLLTGIFFISISTPTHSPAVVAAFSIVFYNGVYTPFKNKTLLAIVPGAICGALPPYIGWLGVGGGFYGYEVALLVSLFFLWQIPHYWLVMLTYPQDYLRTEQPNFLRRISEPRLKKLFVTWIGALVVVMLLYLLLPLYLNNIYRFCLVLNCVALLVIFIRDLAVVKTVNYRRLFLVLNLALFLHMAIIMVSRWGGV
jgi:protoheme IX farnesyltransferase